MKEWGYMETIKDRRKKDMGATMEEENREMIEFMLDNAVLEEKMGKWKQKEEDVVLFMDFMSALIRRSREDGGLIISIKSKDVPIGAENIEIFRKEKKGDVNIVAGENNRRFAMVFTSRKRFEKCDDTSGFVMFIDELFAFLEAREEIDGVIMNYKEEDVVFSKEMLRVFVDLLDYKGNIEGKIGNP